MENEIYKRQWKCNLQVHTHTHTRHSQLGTFSQKTMVMKPNDATSCCPSPHHPVHFFHHGWKNLTNDEQQNTKAGIREKRKKKLVKLNG